MTKSVGNIIKSRLKQLKRTQGWLAEEAEVSNTAVSKWIATGKISRDNAVDVARILSVSLDELLSASDSPTASQAPTLSLVYVDAEELRLLTAYREATPTGKTLIGLAIEGAPKTKPIGLTTPHKS